MPNPMKTIVSRAGRPRSTSVYTAAGQRRARDRLVRTRATASPRASPPVKLKAVKTRVFLAPSFRSSVNAPPAASRSAVLPFLTTSPYCSGSEGSRADTALSPIFCAF